MRENVPSVRRRMACYAKSGLITTALWDNTTSLYRKSRRMVSARLQTASVVGGCVYLGQTMCQLHNHTHTFTAVLHYSVAIIYIPHF